MIGLAARPYDAIVVGGGPAGSVTAACLARAGCRVLVLDRGGGVFRGGDALAPSAKPILRRLGLEAALRDGPHLPCYANQSCWGSDDLWETDFLRSPWGHGWHLDRAAFDGLLVERAESEGAEVRQGARLVKVVRTGSSWRVSWRAEPGEPERGDEGRWLVDATGHRRALLRRLGVGVHRADRQVARIGVFELPPGARGGPEADPDTRTLIEACPEGWWYTARVPMGRRLAIFFSDPDLPQWRTLRHKEDLVAAVRGTRFVRQRLESAGYRLVESPVTRTASTNRTEQVFGDGWLAAGDAAVSWDPLSGKGVETALRGGEQAALAIAAALQGDLSGLQRYGAWIDENWASFCDERARYCAMEQRWAGREFWRRRVRAELG